jgi:transposase, IS5 family
MEALKKPAKVNAGLCPGPRSVILFQRAFGEGSMKPRALRETGQNDLFKARLDQIVDLGHELVLLALAIDWGFLEASFGAAYSDEPGQPPLPVRRMAGLAILKHTFNLSDEELTARWLENPYFQYFCGEEFFQHTAPFDRSSMTRFRQRACEQKWCAVLRPRMPAMKSSAPSGRRTGVHFA